MMAAAQPFISAPSQDRQHAGGGHGRRGGAAVRGVVEAGPEGRRHLPRQLQGGPADVGRQEEGRADRTGTSEPQAPAAATALGDHVLPGGRRGGLHHGGVLSRRRAGRDLPEDLEAGIHALGRDGRVLGGHLHRAAVRGAAGDLHLEVHQHEVRALRHDERSRHPVRLLAVGLRLQAAGTGLPLGKSARTSGSRPSLHALSRFSSEISASVRVGGRAG